MIPTSLLHESSLHHNVVLLLQLAEHVDDDRNSLLFSSDTGRLHFPQHLWDAGVVDVVEGGVDSLVEEAEGIKRVLYRYQNETDRKSAGRLQQLAVLRSRDCVGVYENHRDQVGNWLTALHVFGNDVGHFLDHGGQRGGSGELDALRLCEYLASDILDAVDFLAFLATV